MRVIGHRGACGYLPENTLDSFELALELGVDMIEFDAHVLPREHEAGTPEVVVIHDDTLEATTNGCGGVENLSFDMLRRLDAGNGQVIPTLRESIECVGRRVPINIDVKSEHFAPAIAGNIAYYLSRGWRHDHFVVSSVNQGELGRFMRLMPDIEAGVIYPEEPDGFVDFAMDNHTAFATLNSAFLKARHVREAHRHGLEVRVFTVNDAVEARRLKKLGVDAIFSNYPDIVRRHLGRSAVASGLAVQRPRSRAALPLAAAG